jgi:RHS repeat-associated protein
MKETLVYSYHPDQSLKSEQSALKDANYTYDEINNRKSIQNSLGADFSGTYEYDVDKKLVGMNGDNSIQYDSRGNVVSDSHHNGKSVRSFSALNQLTSVSITNPSSGGGTCIKCIGPVPEPPELPSPITWPFSLNGFEPTPSLNLLSTGNGSSLYAVNNSSTTNTTTMKYNALGYRVVKSGPNGKFRFIYDTQGRLIAEQKNGSAFKEYIYIGQQLVAVRIGSSIYYVLNDNQMRPEVVTDAQGTIKWRAFNHGFGREVKVNSIGDLNIGYPGQYYDAEIGTWYNIRRDYDAKTGRYLQSDPLGTIDGPNTYIYTGNSPTNRVDPTGEFWQVISAAVAVADIGYQLYNNGGDLSKINWTEAAIGAVTGGAGKVASTAYKKKKQKSQIKTEIADNNVTKKALPEHTKHSLNQKINRKVKTSDELDAIRNPLDKRPVKYDSQGRPSQRYVGEKAEVAINPDTNKIVSVNPTSSKKAARLKRRNERNQ